MNSAVENVADKDVDEIHHKLQEGSAEPSAGGGDEISAHRRALLNKIKITFKDEPQVYSEFNHTVYHYRIGRIGIEEALGKFVKLLEPHSDLLLGFNVLLRGYKIDYNHSLNKATITKTPVNSKSRILFGAPIPVSLESDPSYKNQFDFLRKVENRFRDQPHIQEEFFDTLIIYKDEEDRLKKLAGKQLTDEDIYFRFAKLLHNHDDLFSYFFKSVATTEFSTGNFIREFKTRFLDQPDIYNTFMETVDKCFKDKKPLTKVYSEVAKLLVDHDDLLIGFVRLLPYSRPNIPGQSSMTNQDFTAGGKRSSASLPNLCDCQVKKVKSSSLPQNLPIAKAGKYAGMSDYAFFDEVYKSVQSPRAYNSFMRFIHLANEDVITPSELLDLVTPYIRHEPELLQWFKSFICDRFGRPMLSLSCIDASGAYHQPSIFLGSKTSKRKLNINCRTSKRLGASYCLVPKDDVQPECSGRTTLCKEVLNDQWVSFPSWSEESTFVTSKKILYEEYIYRCEDERFELDVAIETNLSLIRVLENIQKKMSRMTAEEIEELKFDDYLGGTSPCLNQRAVWRLYGDEADHFMESLKTEPGRCVAIVLKRAKARDEEWREGQKRFNKIWAKTNEIYYPKSLDPQGFTFKQNDSKALRSKCLFDEIGNLFNQRHMRGVGTGPHMSFSYKDHNVLDDAQNLLLHYVSCQTTINKEDREQMKSLLEYFIPELFHHQPRQQSSGNNVKNANDTSPTPGTSQSKGKLDGSKHSIDQDLKAPVRYLRLYLEDAYTLFFGNNMWYLFFRYHQILCERLSKFSKLVNKLIEDEREMQSTSKASKLEPNSEYLTGVATVDYYSAFLKIVGKFLDGNMDADTYEDTLREMFGIHAYMAFTLERVISHAVKQLQHLALDATCFKINELYREEARKGGAGGRCVSAQSRLAREMAYQRKAETILAEENCFKIIIYKRECQLTIELMDTDVEEGRPARASRFQIDDDDDDDDDDLLTSGSGGRARRPGLVKAIFLPRNLRCTRDSSISSQQQKQPITDASKIDSPDDSDCSFNLNTPQSAFVFKRETFFYKKNSLPRAKQSHQNLSRRMCDKFTRWHENWVSKHVDQSQREETTDWLMGLDLDSDDNSTYIIEHNDLSKPPYRSYNSYKVEVLDED